MKVNVITRHVPSNYGSLLQSLATIKAIRTLGHQPVIIDYCRKDDTGFKKVWTEANLKYDSTIKRLAYTLVRLPVEHLAERRFSKMRRKYLPMTKKCWTYEDLSALTADVFMTGSDQVWGPMVNGKYDEAYFLNFVKGCRKVSYAASFGKKKLDVATISIYKKLLSTYDKIAVREESAAQLLKEWSLSNCIGQVLDPTLLLTGDDWRLFAGLAPAKTKPYVLVYQLHNDFNLSDYAKSMACKMNMKLVRVNPFLHQIGRGGQFVCCPDVKVFLRLINDASMIVTDSFHGTCFAINLNKQFVEILPNNATSTRNISILNLTGLSGRIVTDYSDYGVVNTPIEYDQVNRILDCERNKSISILKELLS